MVGKCISETARNEVAIYLLSKSQEGKLSRGTLKEAAVRFGVKDRTISDIWKLANKPRLVGEMLDVKSKRIGNKNRKRLLPDIEHIKTLKWEERDTMERVAENTGVSVGTVHSWVCDGLLKPHSSPLHPQLNDANKYNRMKHALNYLNAMPFTRIKFAEMSNIIHMDEKWFYITYDGHKLYVVDGEELPYRSCQSKRYITKVMFMCAVSRPLYSEDGELLFDGKIGMFPFTKQQPAARRSKNRARGTLETKPINSITKQVTKECIIQQVIPAIKSKWPEGASKHIFIQQDNVKPHIKNNDPDFMAVANTDDFKIKLIFQPINSPDLNCNDLGYFRALQSLQSKKAAKSVDELVNSVMQAFVDYSPIKLNNIFLTLQSVMVEIMKAKGHNDFAIPHMKKGHLAALGILPRNLEVNEDLVRQCIAYLQGIAYLRKCGRHHNSDITLPRLSK
ncbi:hypothetical protein RND81_06G085800 [Saponaria officinalis]|uniref:DUF7769 domain-containing protein n=1 Tax=Saponaria officinalis TaxID=3572 RepID=A0AAW1K8R8_SAPOF